MMRSQSADVLFRPGETTCPQLAMEGQRTRYWFSLSSTMEPERTYRRADSLKAFAPP